MELVSPQQLDDILEVLRDHGVTLFSCPVFSVTLGVAVVPESESLAATGELIRVPRVDGARGLYANPALWPSGTPPQFPKKDS